MGSLMRAVVMMGAYNISVIDVPRPTILNGTDAIVRVTSSALCGSDLHYYHQDLGTPEEPYRIGHEAIGYIDEIGDAVSSLKVGDYVVVPFSLDDGHFHYGPDLVEVRSGAIGMQTEYARIPFADHSLIPVPVNASSNASTVYDYLFMSDIFGTGYQALDFAGMQTGDTVAVFGAGPVGQMAAYSALIRGASKVYIVDRIQERLDLAATYGAIPINFAESDPVEAIRALEPGGVQRAVDCVGFEAVDAQGNTNSSIVLHNAQRVIAPQGGIGIIGVYGQGNQSQTIDISAVFNGGFSVAGGASNPLGYATTLESLITSGKAHPGFIVSDSINIEDAPEYYRRFDQKEVLKVVIDFPL